MLSTRSAISVSVVKPGTMSLVRTASRTAGVRAVPMGRAEGSPELPARLSLSCMVT